MENEKKRKKCVISGNSIAITGYLQSQRDMINIKNIYHYTDVTGFLGIIKNRDFWLFSPFK